MNSMIEAVMQIPAEHETNIFGQFDENIKKIERTLNVTMISRDGQLKMIGPSTNVKRPGVFWNNWLHWLSAAIR